MRVNAKSPIKKAKTTFLLLKRQIIYISTIKSPNNNPNITSITSNPKTNSTPQLNNNPHQTTPNETPPSLRTN